MLVAICCFTVSLFPTSKHPGSQLCRPVVSSKAQNEGVSIANPAATCRAHGESHLPDCHGDITMRFLPKSPMHHTSKMAAAFEEISILHFFFHSRYLPHPFKKYISLHTYQITYLFVPTWTLVHTDITPSRGTWDLPAPPARPEQCIGCFRSPRDE